MIKLFKNKKENKTWETKYVVYWNDPYDRPLKDYELICLKRGDKAIEFESLDKAKEHAKLMANYDNVVYIAELKPMCKISSIKVEECL